MLFDLVIAIIIVFNPTTGKVSAVSTAPVPSQERCLTALQQQLKNIKVPEDEQIYTTCARSVIEVEQEIEIDGFI
jgi:hypothetical protein